LCISFNSFPFFFLRIRKILSSVALAGSSFPFDPLVIQRPSFAIFPQLVSSFSSVIICAIVVLEYSSFGLSSPPCRICKESLCSSPKTCHTTFLFSGLPARYIPLFTSPSHSFGLAGRNVFFCRRDDEHCFSALSLSFPITVDVCGG